MRRGNCCWCTAVPAPTTRTLSLQLQGFFGLHVALQVSEQQLVSENAANWIRIRNGH